jgi:protein-tyrosine phosphatase
MSRVHHIPGLYNLRDLGGFVTSNGKITRTNVFWRGDSPHRINASNIAYFTDHQITTVIDLRHDHEQRTAPNPLATQSDINYVAIPLFQATHHTTNVITRLDEFYIYLLEHSRSPIQQTFMQLAVARHGTFFHCRVGKDRTGIIAALLLDLVAVPYPKSSPIMSPLPPISRHCSPNCAATDQLASTKPLTNKSSE